MYFIYFDNNRKGIIILQILNILLYIFLELQFTDFKIFNFFIFVFMPVQNELRATFCILTL